MPLVPFTDHMDTATPSPPNPGGAVRINDLAAATKSDRNRAVDFYRAIAMLAVAVGHWLAMVAVAGPDGEIQGGNALEHVAGLAWATWLLQVMPLFFVVGGFASGMSLDAHYRNGGRPQDWIAARLRRMLPPAATLAGTWLVVIAVATMFGAGPLALTAASAAAIPLWFLANYTIDTALAPFMLPRFRRNPGLVAGGLAGAFTLFELLRIVDVPVIPHVNWVIGWLGFQMLGMAWRDGMLPTGRPLLVATAAAWAGALVLVLSNGPWSISMVNFPGMENSPTHPPTLSLWVFGLAYSLTAIAAAPAISEFLARSPIAWQAVIGANAIAMSVYLWHMTAAIVLIGAMHYTIGLPTAAVGTGTWFAAKIPLILASSAVLALIVRKVAPIEQRALVAPRRPWNGSAGSMILAAAVLSTGLKAWTSGGLAMVIGCAVIVAFARTSLSPTAPTPQPVVSPAQSIG